MWRRRPWRLQRRQCGRRHPGVVAYGETGILARSTSGWAVYALADSGSGVYAAAANGIALEAHDDVTLDGPTDVNGVLSASRLSVSGPLNFDHAGSATVADGNVSETVTVGPIP